MSYCAQQILDLATSIYSDIGSPSDQSVGYLSGVISNSGFLGQINNTLGTCFYLSGDAPCIVGFTPEEGAIGSLMYQTNYFQKARLAVLQGGISSAADSWVQLDEGDSRIKRDSRTLYAKEYGALWKDADKSLKEALSYWTLNHTVPQGINAAQTYGWPSP